ncbi:hypothetical protein DFQ26_008654 [Actinomortierella ambigua]|nr:hypothetical protein DFQ26_008654 [Actinomortierella ambigua]
MASKSATTPVVQEVPSPWRPLVALGPSANAHTFPGTAEGRDEDRAEDAPNHDNPATGKTAGIHPKNLAPQPLSTKPPDRPGGSGSSGGGGGADGGGHGASSSQRRYTPTSLAKLLPTLFESSSSFSFKTTDGLGQPSIHSSVWSSSSSSSFSSPWSASSTASFAERLVPPAPIGQQGNGSRGRLSTLFPPKKPSVRSDAAAAAPPAAAAATTTTTGRWPLGMARQSSSHLRLGSKRFSFFVPSSSSPSSKTTSSHRASGIVRRAPSLPIQPILTNSRDSSSSSSNGGGGGGGGGIGIGIGGGASSLFPFSLVTYETGGLLGELKHTSTAVCTHAPSSIVAPGTPVPAGVCVVTGTPPPIAMAPSWHLPAGASPLRESLLCGGGGSGSNSNSYYSQQMKAYRNSTSGGSSNSSGSHNNNNHGHGDIIADMDDKQLFHHHHHHFHHHNNNNNGSCNNNNNSSGQAGRYGHYSRFEEKGAVATWADYLNDSVVIQTSHVAIYEINGRWGSRLLMFLLFVFGAICVLAGGFCTEAYCQDLSLCSDGFTSWHQPYHSHQFLQ